MVHKSQRRLPGRAEGCAEPVRGQDDRKRERQARDGVSRPAGGARPVARSFPGSWHPSKVRGQGGKALCPLAAPAKRQVGKSPQPTEGGTDHAASIASHATMQSTRGDRWASQAQHQPTRAMQVSHGFMNGSPPAAQGGADHAASIPPPTSCARLRFANRAYKSNETGAR